MKLNFKKLVPSILVPLAVGGLAALITKDSMETFAELKKPPLSPPGFLFPIVWTVLFILMGISFYLIWTTPEKNGEKKTMAYVIYYAQLAVNFCWSLIFFKFGEYVFAFVWLLALIAMIAAMIVSFARISKKAAYLQLPYILWTLFAAYLNLMICILNK